MKGINGDKNVQKNFLFLLGSIMIVQGAAALAYDTSPEFIREKQLEFASQYEYHEGDTEKSTAQYPHVSYAAVNETAADGTIFECPAIYVDWHAMLFNSINKEETDVTFIINGEENPAYSRCVLFNSRLLVPVEAFNEVGCDVNFNGDTYVATVEKDGTVLEILPNLIGMRKNRENGFYVPLHVCARFIDDVFYVPVRAVAEEFNLEISWDEATRMVVLNN